MPKASFHPFSDKTPHFVDAPKPATKSMPEWYREQPAVNQDHTDYKQGNVGTTIKKCMPIFDAMTAGYIFGAPCDIYVNAKDPNKLEYSIPRPLNEFKGDLFSTHSFEQYSEYPIDLNKYHKQLLRIQPFWSIETPEGYSTLFINPIHRPSPLFAFAGLIDTDNFVSEGHLSFLVEKDFEGVIKQGTPIIQLIPFKREAWESEVIPAEISMPRVKTQGFKLRSVFSNAYKNKFRVMKEYK
jgi:hypothetical protein